MTQAMPTADSPTSPPSQSLNTSSESRSPRLPIINTNELPTSQTTLQQPTSNLQNRLSAYSTISKLTNSRSRPASAVLPIFHSSLPYTLVRDFAYPIQHPLHYGPPLETSNTLSGDSTPASEKHRRLSDPPSSAWDHESSWRSEGFFPSQQLPQMTFGDGPPYSEDEDLHSPIVVSSRHKKHKSASPGIAAEKGKGRRKSEDDDDAEDMFPSHDGRRGYFAGMNGDGSQTYYIGDEDESADGPGGELVTYPPDQGQSLLSPDRYRIPGQRDSHFATTLPNRSYGELPEDSDDDGSGIDPRDSRYSKDYQFTIASPDEEMHGKAVALFDFTRENENELPLKEGQIIWVSYRHGQGWLVAEDPKTGDAGLVPEEYVRLLRDIEGGWSSLSGEPPIDENGLPSLEGSSPDTALHSIQVEADQQQPLHDRHNSNSSGEKRPPIVSTFSTSSKDLEPYPHHLLEGQAGGTPPQVVHYGSQTNTPTVTSPAFISNGHRGHEEAKRSEGGISRF